MSAFTKLMQERDVSEFVGDDYAWAQLVWNEALEAAAKVCDGMQVPVELGSGPFTASQRETCSNIARAIRAIVDNSQAKG